MQIQPESFREAVHTWYDPLFRFALTLCRNTEDAEDLTQNAFHKLASKGAQIHDEGKIKSWLFSVLRREFIDQYRRRRRYPESDLDSLPEIALTQKPNALANRIDAQAMLRALAGMDEKFRSPLTLFYLQQFSYKDIAEILDIPIGTVMSRLRRGKDQLRACLEQTGAEPARSTIPFKPKEASHG